MSSRYLISENQSDQPIKQSRFL